MDQEVVWRCNYHNNTVVLTYGNLHDGRTRCPKSNKEDSRRTGGVRLPESLGDDSEPPGYCHPKLHQKTYITNDQQLYSDWLYLWWVAYTAKMHGHIYIILKESLKYVPFLGLGMQFYGFIFLARKWEQDKPRFIHRLSKLAAGTAESNPMWLLIFPEGTNLSDNGRNASKRFADKMGWPDMRHQLIPRTTGLRFCLEQLQGSVEWVYDCTVAYEGIE